MQYFTYYDSPIGKLTLCSDGDNLTGLWFENQIEACKIIIKCAQNCQLPIFKTTFKWLDLYFSGSVPNFLPPISLSALNEFRQSICKMLLKIPYGKLTTYGALAKKLQESTGRRMSAQAVGGAVGHNPIGIIIPCHRVIGANGNLTGYAGGIDKKIALLKIEGVDVNKT